MRTKRHPPIAFIALDVLCAPIAMLCGIPLSLIRRVGLQRLLLTKRVLHAVGMLPIRHHYYEPLVYAEDLRTPLDAIRSLQGLDLNTEAQLTLLSRFEYSEELKRFPLHDAGNGQFYYSNGMFEVGDAEILYCVIRHFKPARILEVGSGFSTLIARLAIAANQAEDSRYKCDHVCIEPFENDWLERTGATVVRERIERCPSELWTGLAKNDVLVIDSSHTIRPQGDVLFEYLELLPQLATGVLVHIHDVFTPRDYPGDWVLNRQRLWNEQYLLEAFLSFNRDYQILLSLNYLWHDHKIALSDRCPMLAGSPGAEPGSFWITRR